MTHILLQRWRQASVANTSAHPALVQVIKRFHTGLPDCRHMCEFTCHNPRRYGGNHRCLGLLVHAREEAEQQPILRHGVDHTRHRKHGAQQTTQRNTKAIELQLLQH